MSNSHKKPKNEFILCPVGISEISSFDIENLKQIFSDKSVILYQTENRLMELIKGIEFDITYIIIKKIFLKILLHDLIEQKRI